MPTFLYRGYSAQGQRVGGALLCDNRAQMETAISNKGITDYMIYESGTRYDTRPYAFTSPGELAFFCREATVLLSSDIAPAEGLAIIAEQTANRHLKQAITEICDHVAKGLTVVGAISMYGHVFGAYLPLLAAAGEASGRTVDVFNDLADFYDREKELRDRLRTALLYPAARIIVLWCAVFLLLSQCLPVLDGLLSDMGASLGFWLGLYRQGWMLAAVIAALSILIWLAMRFNRTRVWIDRQLLSISVFRAISMPVYAGRLARGLTLILRYDASPMDTDAYLRIIVNNHCMEAKIENAVGRLRSGQELTAVMESIKYFPPVLPPALSKMVLLGYQTGRTSEMLKHAADWFTAEAERAIERTASVIEPALMLLMALTAGLPLLRVLLPLIDILRVMGA